MKKMNIKLTIMVLALLAVMQVQAQEYSVKVSDPGKTILLVKEVNRVSVEAYDGKEIQFFSDRNDDKPERAKGLKSLSARGEDNTGIGLNVEQKNNEVVVFQVSSRGKGRYTLKVPKTMTVQIEHTGQWEGGKIEVKGLTGELEISGRYNSVYLEDISGPALVNTVYGEIEASFSNLSQSGPTSLVSVYGSIDVSVPASTKANLVIKTPYGESYSDLTIDVGDISEMRNISSVIEGKINGGGVDLGLKASYKNVYLRKK